MRGTLVPLYGPNNLPASCSSACSWREGGARRHTYEVVGRPGNPVPHINPISALAPGLLRGFSNSRRRAKAARTRTVESGSRPPRNEPSGEAIKLQSQPAVKLRAMAPPRPE
jgi:hypothetical protein